MDVSILTKRFYPGPNIPVFINKAEVLSNLPGFDKRFRFVLVQKGTGILRINSRRISLIAPAALCINEKEDVSIEDSQGWAAQGFYFHPQFINANLTLDKIRGKHTEFLITEKQDLFLLKPFVERNETYIGLFDLDILIAKTLAGWLESIKNEIEEQSHQFWSCRARSYFLELLFALVTIYQSPEAGDISVIRNESDLINKVILYLNANYHRKITIFELTQKFNTNRTTLQKQFQEATGQSVLSYLIALRIKLAALMLKDTRLPVSEIVEKLGFNDSAHFNKMFHKQMGYSPTKYRQQFTWTGQ